MATYPIYQVDAFTNKTFGGNPAAVVPLKTWLSDELMLKIAEENNLSETAFFIQTDNGFHIRWFTPTEEVNLCGHATLATSWVIYNALGYNTDHITFDSLSGPLIVQKLDDKFTLDFPTWDSKPNDEDKDILTQALGKEPTEIYKGKKVVALFDDENFIRNVRPNIPLLGTIKCEGVVISALSSDPQYDFVTRYFGPQLGINEDPVTGSAHCILTPIWAKKLNQTKFKACQVSARGGDLDLEIKDNRLLIGGEAKLYMKGKIYV